MRGSRKGKSVGGVPRRLLGVFERVALSPKVGCFGREKGFRARTGSVEERRSGRA